MNSPAVNAVQDVTPSTQDFSVTVHFDVGGRIFRFPLKLVQAHPQTLLAQLLAADESEGQAAILVDCIAPERFGYILDWYRSGEIWVSPGVPVEPILADAKRLGLPSEVLINGVARMCRRADNAAAVGRAVTKAIVNQWPGFAEFFQSVLSDIRKHYARVAHFASDPRGAQGFQDAAAEEAFDFPRFVLPLFDETGWLKPQQVASASRARVLALKLEDLGYRCEFSETELLVGLSLRLRVEDLPVQAHEEPAEQEEPFEAQEEEEAEQLPEEEAPEDGADAAFSIREQ